MKEVVGVRYYSFPDDKTGELVEGCRVHLQWQEDDTKGICCEQHNLSRKKLEGYEPQIGDLVRVGLNRYGRADFIVKVG